jgi:hypothetical protein
VGSCVFGARLHQNYTNEKGLPRPKDAQAFDCLVAKGGIQTLADFAARFA